MVLFEISWVKISIQSSRRQGASIMNAKKLEGIQKLLNEMVDTSYVAGVNCMMLHKGKEIGYYEAGYSDLKTKKPLTRDTIFLLYSMSKPITAAAAMLLLEQGKFDLLDPVEKYIPSFKGQMVGTQNGLVPCEKPVTIKDLLCMTAGITYGNDFNRNGIEVNAVFEEIKEKLLSDECMTTRAFADRIGQIPLAFQPGSKWEYGACADVLGAVIEVIANQPLSEFIEENLLNPLEMKDTGFYVPEEKQNRLSKVYEETDKGLVQYNGNHLGILIDMNRKPRFESGGAGLVSTIDDYSHFATMLLNKGEYKGRNILSPSTVKFMTTSELLPKLNQDVATWDGLKGHTYSNLLRIMNAPELAVFCGSKGEYGWDGWLGPYFANDPAHDLTFIMMQQKINTGTTPYTRKLRNVVASAIEEL